MTQGHEGSAAEQGHPSPDGGDFSASGGGEGGRCPSAPRSALLHSCMGKDRKLGHVKPCSALRAHQELLG